MALETILKNIHEARKAYDTALGEAGKQTRDEFAQALGKTLPEGFAVQWAQYTPYFNDGEACTFSVHEPAVFKVEHNGTTREFVNYKSEASLYEACYGIDRYGGSDKYDPKAIDGLTRDHLKAFADAWAAAHDEDMLERIWGDHARIVVKSDGTWTLNDHDHD